MRALLSVLFVIACFAHDGGSPRRAVGLGRGKIRD